jgi:selenocysteine lyase/cysteine desulfurase
MTPEPAAARAASIAFEHADPQAVREALEEADVLVTGELGRVRASVHVYTTDEDLAIAADTLRDVLG